MDTIDKLIHDGALVSMVIGCFASLVLSALCGLLSLKVEGYRKQRCRAVAGALFAVSMLIVALFCALLSLLIGSAAQSLYLLVGGIFISILLVVLALNLLVESISRFE